MKHLIEHRERFVCAQGCLVLWSRLHSNKHPRACTGFAPLTGVGLPVGVLEKQGKAGTREKNDWADRPLHPAARLWKGQLPAALLGSASDCKPKQHWQQQATIFNYTAGIICSLKNSLIALCLTTSAPLSQQPGLECLTITALSSWNTSTWFCSLLLKFFLSRIKEV